MRDYNFFAFISYRSTDREWAQWLQHMLEHYRLPTVINELITRVRAKCASMPLTAAERRRYYLD